MPHKKKGSTVLQLLIIVAIFATLGIVAITQVNKEVINKTQETESKILQNPKIDVNLLVQEGYK
jgi:Tfp pilus assembly protein PilE